jgi:hypothetical protein
MTTLTFLAWPAPAPTGRRVVRELVWFKFVGVHTCTSRCRDCDPRTVRGVLRWTSTDPHAVAMVFRPGTRPEITWLVDRDVLADGVHGPAGLGDVSVLPDRRSRTYRELVLSSPDGRCALRFRVAALVAFLDRIRAAEGGAR